MSAIYLNGTKLTGADNASNVIAQDVLGLVEQAGDDTTVQALLDEIADRVADKLLTKTAASSLYIPQSVQNVVGCKNLLPQTSFVTSTVIGGITFTVNSDGSVTANGTNNSGATVYFTWSKRYGFLETCVFLKNGEYIGSGLTNGADDTYFISLAVTKNGSYVRKGTITTGEVEFTIDGDDSSNDGAYINYQLSILNGKSINETIKPMIRLASYKDSTYEPYAMTNRELTAATTATVAYNTTNCSGGNMKITRLGNLRIVTGYFEPRTTATSASPITVATLSAGDYSDISSGTRSLCGREKFNTQSEFVIGGVATLTAAGNIVYQGYSSGANMFFTLVFAV